MEKQTKGRFVNFGGEGIKTSTYGQTHANNAFSQIPNKNTLKSNSYNVDYSMHTYAHTQKNIIVRYIYITHLIHA